MLKRGIVGTYHMVSAKHLQAYVDEFSGRHNLRGLDTVDQMGAVAGGGWPGSGSAIGSVRASLRVLESDHQPREHHQVSVHAHPLQPAHTQRRQRQMMLQTAKLALHR